MSGYLRSYVGDVYSKSNALSYSVPSAASVASIAACLTVYSKSKPLPFIGRVEGADSTHSTT